MATERLIDVVYRHPELYDKSHRDYRKLGKKEKTWKVVARAVGKGSSDQLKRRWKNLRDTYSRLLKYNAEAVEGTVPKRWIWAERMEIFRPFISPTHSSGELSAPEADQQAPGMMAEESEDSVHDQEAAHESELNEGPPTSLQHELITCDVEVNTETPVITKHEVDRLCFSETTTSSEVHMPHVAKRRAAMVHTESQLPVIAYVESKTGADEIDSLFLAYAMTVKKFSPRRQALTKLKMAQLIAEEELSHVEENELLTTQDYNHLALP